ncbi:MAG: bacterioferritin [Deltaproteobacteria bacterium RBG_13_61_14]|jgi:bacterioferritin|nr:MAG: bacterioferritin [Deltaproteobacteria bacterium RBG_13_61_14]
MKGNEKLLTMLNKLLADELTAINQYMVHAEMCHNWGYEKLHENIQKRAITEMKHAEELIERIIFLEGKPIVSQLNPIHIGAEVPKMMENDLAAEMKAVKGYNAGVKLAVEVGDNATREILEGILKDEDDHVDDIEEQRDEIAQMGLPIYLSTKK